MAIKQTLEVINRMEADGVVGRYAIAGAVAAYNYVEPAVTEDLDILISFDRHPRQPKSGLATLAPVLSYLQQKGYAEFRRGGLNRNQSSRGIGDKPRAAAAAHRGNCIADRPAQRPHPHRSVPGGKCGRPRRPVRCHFPPRPSASLAGVLPSNWICRPLRCTTDAMKDAEKTIYPDISDILARKRKGRRQLSRLSF